MIESMRICSLLVLSLLVGCAASPPPEVEPPATLPEFALGYLPLALHPLEPRLLLSEQFGAIVDCMREDDWRSATILLHWLRQEFPASNEAAALHWYSLVMSGDSGDAVARAENHPSSNTTGGRCALAFGLQAQNRFSAAHQAFKEVLIETPRDPLVLAAAARSAQAAGLGFEAARLLDAHILVSPLSHELEVLRAESLFGAGRFTEAASQLERLLDADPGQAEWWNMSGLCMFRIGFNQDQAEAGANEIYFDRAVRCFTEASNLVPQAERYQFNLGCALDWGGDPSSAELAYLRAIELHPGYMSAVGNLVELWVEQGRFTEVRKLLESQMRQPLTPGEIARVEALLLGVR